MDSRNADHADPPDGPTGLTRHRLGRAPDRRLEQELGELEVRLRDAPEDTEARKAAVRRARSFVASARVALDRHPAQNEQAWAWFHAARGEEPRWWSEAELAAREEDLRQEVQAKLESWRLKAAVGYESKGVGRLESVIGMQQHIDEVSENDNRKRILQRRQLVIYLAVLFVTLLAVCALEFWGVGLAHDIDGPNRWWVISAVLYGILGGAFSSAQRVAAAGPAARYPELRWARVANVLRPLAGGAGAVVAFAAMEDALGADVRTSGARIAVVCFVAGFSERFIPSLAARHDSTN